MIINQSRKLALEILDRVENQSSYLNILISSLFSKYQLKDSDRALIQEVSYGVTRYKKSLDWIIDQFLVNKKKAISISVRNILRMGIYQILYLERIPDYAIVYELVELVKHSPYSSFSGMVNAILRNVIRNSNKIEWPNIETDPVKYISVFYSYPEWLVERWVNRFGLEVCLDICKTSNMKPDFTLRVNPLKIDIQQFQKKLYEEDISFQKSIHLPDMAIIIKDFHKINNTTFFEEGLFSIQNESSMLASEYLAPVAGEIVFDMCSGPGGKSTHMAQIMQNRGEIISFEINKSRLAMVMTESKRLGINIISPVLNDSQKLNNKYLGKADKVLVDAPCSGTGVIRRKPDLKWKRWDLKHLDELNQLQRKLLDTAAHYLKPGGELVYATCSMETEENDGIILEFIRKHPEFIIQNSSQFIEKNSIVRYKTDIKEAIQLIPGYSGDDIDGFYMVKMRKNN